MTRKSASAKIRYSEPVKCGHCGNTAPMPIVASHSGIVLRREDGTGAPYEAGDMFELLKCPTCENPQLRKYFWDDMMDGSEVTFTTLYPSTTPELRGLPPSIAKAYESALRVKAVDANAFGVLLRRMLELVCIDRGANGRTLHEQLQDLATRGEIPKKLVHVAVNLKNFGNIGAHAGSGELTPAEIPILDSLSRAVLEYVYSAPELVRTAEERLARVRGSKRPRK